MEYIILRLLSSFLTGVVLSQGGSLVQLTTRNLLASTSTLGVDGMAVLWVLISHALGLWMGVSAWPLMLAGIGVMSLLGIWMEKAISIQNNFTRVILIGVTFNLAVGAIFSLWQFLFLAFNLPFPVELWFGHFRFVEIADVLKILIVFLIMNLGLRFFWRDLTLFSLGPDISKNYPFRRNVLFRFIFISVTVSTYLIVSSFGAFSFLSLVFPILSRRIFFRKSDLKGELFYGSVLNGIVFMLIDFACYQFTFYGAEIPVGLIVTGVGAVSLICVIWKTSHRELLAKPKN